MSKGAHRRPKGHGGGKHEKGGSKESGRSNDPTKCKHPNGKKGARCPDCGTLVV